MHSTLDRFFYPKRLVKEYDHWVVLLREHHVTLGSLVIVAKAEINDLGEVSDEAWADFAQIIRDTEALLRTEFGAEKFNYLALMMGEAHVHFHMFPRYSKPVEFEGRTYVDEDWPESPEMVDLNLTAIELSGIQDHLKENYGKD